MVFEFIDGADTADEPTLLLTFRQAERREQGWFARMIYFRYGASGSGRRYQRNISLALMRAVPLAYPSGKVSLLSVIFSDLFCDCRVLSICSVFCIILSFLPHFCRAIVSIFPCKKRFIMLCFICRSRLNLSRNPGGFILK